MPSSDTGSRLRSLECPSCKATTDAHHPHGTCPTCKGPLFATYDLAHLAGKSWWEQLVGREASLWRYRELLPVQSVDVITTLGEGFSPVLSLGRVPECPGVDLLLKDDGGLPTGSFKARGMAVAVSRARELGLHRLFVPSAGNAGVALAAYAARAGLKASVYLPRRAAPTSERAVRLFGAEVVCTGETIREAGEEARRREAGAGSFDMSTLREPYRVEGKKTMAFEIAEQCGSTGLPDVIVYPTGGGTGLVGMHKGFTELRELGLIDREPRLAAVQSSGCAPVVRAIESNAPRVEPWPNPATIAPGLLVPAPFGSEHVLGAIRASKGGAVEVSDPAIISAMSALATRFGFWASPEGAATWAALPGLVERGLVLPEEKLLLYNTGSGLTSHG
jgi:threonine synthase